ncbi:MAG: glycosyltransferase family 2 protein [Stenotrophobium sp.]
MSPCKPEDVFISVVLPCFNRLDRVVRAIDSVLRQSHRNLELIVVDDGSTEDLHGTVMAIGDPRLRNIRQPRRMGPAVARNAGIRAAKGDWIAFQDSDDEWRADKLQKQVAAALAGAGDATFVCCAYEGLPRDERPSTVHGLGDWPECDLSPMQCFNFGFIPPTWLVRREALLAAGLFDESLPSMEDWDLNFRLVRQGRVVIVQESLVLKHGGQDALSHNIPARLAAFEAIYAKYPDFWAGDRRVCAKFLTEIGRLHFLLGTFPAGRRALLQSLLKRPGWKATGYLVTSLAGGRIYTVIRRAIWKLR